MHRQNHLWRLFISALCALLVVGCEQPATEPWQTFPSRDNGDGKREQLYRAQVPHAWIRLDPEGGSSIADTTKPNATFLIADEIELTLYTFPWEKLAERVAPSAHIARWQQQVGLQGEVTPVSRGGFVGRRLWAAEEQGVLAWAMQLDADHFVALKRRKLNQMSADYTLKATGPAVTLRQHRPTIEAFAQSFELIDELP